MFLGKRLSLNSNFLLAEVKWVLIVLVFEAEVFDWKYLFYVK